MLVFKQGFDGNRNYIATQGPKVSTLNDFWRMCFEQDVRVIVALTLMEEKGRVNKFQKLISYLILKKKNAHYYYFRLNVPNIGQTKEPPVMATFKLNLWKKSI